MKLEIDYEQIQELTVPQKKLLRRKYKAFNTEYINGETGETFRDLKCLTIGKMIEIIESDLPTLYITKDLKQGMMESDRYEVFQQGRGHFYGDTLCDALWEVIKDIVK